MVSIKANKTISSIDYKLDSCIFCGLDNLSTQWIYYEYNDIKVCHFCYKMLVKRND